MDNRKLNQFIYLATADAIIINMQEHASGELNILYTKRGPLMSRF